MTTDHRADIPEDAGRIPNAETQVYCVIGDPISHSLSPSMHNLAFADSGINGIFSAFRVTELKAAIDGVRSLGIKGVAVTLPHKQSVMALLDEIDEMAFRIGAVNTIVNRNGRLYGFNTDCRGAMTALLEGTSVAGKTVWLVGAGGAARALGFGVRAGGGKLTVVNRSINHGEMLATDLNADFVPLSEVRRIDCDILINATSLGMAPRDAVSPIAVELLHPDMVVMDLVYNPMRTRLLAAAEKKGCVTVDGMGMFVHQGAAQFELWTGRKAPVELMRQTVLKLLKEKQ